jgi:hypothetical protein
LWLGVELCLARFSLWVGVLVTSLHVQFLREGPGQRGCKAT